MCVCVINNEVINLEVRFGKCNKPINNFSLFIELSKSFKLTDFSVCTLKPEFLGPFNFVKHYDFGCEN